MPTPTSAATAILTQAQTPVLGGAYEVLVPTQQGRIYFIDYPWHAFELLEVLIGLDYGQHRQRDPQGRMLASRVAREPGLVLRGAHGTEAELYRSRLRPLPQFAVGERVHFFGLSTPYLVTGIGLFEDPRQQDRTTWMYYYAGAVGAGRPIAEAHTTAAIPEAEAGAQSGGAD